VAADTAAPDPLLRARGGASVTAMAASGHPTVMGALLVEGPELHRRPSELDGHLREYGWQAAPL